MRIEGEYGVPVESVLESFRTRSDGEDERLLAVLEDLRTNAVGPALRLSAGVFGLNLSLAEPVDSAFIASMRSIEAPTIRMSFEMPSYVSGLPWTASTSVVVRTPVQASLVVLHALRLALQVNASLSPLVPAINCDTELLYAPVETLATVPRGRRVRCPLCDTVFNTRDESAWDGERHRFCRQRIRLRP